MKAIKAKDIMNKNVITISENQSIVEACRIMNDNNTGFLPVLNKFDELSGVITDRDIITRLISKEKDIYLPVSSIMTSSIIKCSKNDDLSHIITKMADSQIRRIIVSEKDNVIGIIGLYDLLKIDNIESEICELLKEILLEYPAVTTLFKDISMNTCI